MFDELLKDNRVIMCVGEMDTGKSTLVSSMIEEQARKGEQVIHVDLDMGQSTIGPPTTIGLRMADGKEWLCFVGNTSPFGVFKEFGKGLGLFKELLETRPSDRVIVDTPGLARGYYAWLLARTEIEMLGVGLVVVLQKAGEAEHLVGQLEKRAVDHVTLESHKEARARSAGERTRYRERLFQDYFRNARIRTISTARRRVSDMGRAPEEGLLAGLLDDRGFVVCLGVFYGAAEGGMRVAVPQCVLKTVKQIRLGRYVIGAAGAPACRPLK